MTFCFCLAWHDLSIFGDTFNKDTCSSLSTKSQWLYLVTILIRIENVVLHKYVVAKDMTTL